MEIKESIRKTINAEIMAWKNTDIEKFKEIIKKDGSQKSSTNEQRRS